MMETTLDSCGHHIKRFKATLKKNKYGLYVLELVFVFEEHSGVLGDMITILMPPLDYYNKDVFNGLIV